MKKFLIILIIIMSLLISSCTTNNKESDYFCEYLGSNFDDSPVTYYLVSDRNYEGMFNFIGKEKFYKGQQNYVYFLDKRISEISLPHPLSLDTGIILTHVVAEFIVVVFENGNCNYEFNSYEKNAWDSSPTKLYSNQDIN